MSVVIDTDTEEVRATAQLRAVGGSAVVTLPKEIRDRLDLTAGQHVTFAVPFDSDTVEVRPVRETESEE